MISLVDLLLENLNDPKAIILAGAPGAGKGSVLRDLDLSGLKTLNLDDTIAALSKQDGFTLNQKTADAEDRRKFMKAMAQATAKLKGNPKKGIKGDLPQTIEDRESFILDGTSASKNQTVKLVNDLKEAGYKIMMLYVYTDLETSLKRNQKRFEKSDGKDRSLLPGAVLSTWKDVTKNFNEYQNLFRNNFVSVSNTGDSETMKNIEDILKTYIEPFSVKDGKPKTEKEKARSKTKKEELNKEIQDILNSDQLQNIINSSVSKKEAQSKINSFIK
jgi:adenylate kinase family enzyme